MAGAAIAVLCVWQWLRERMDTLSTMDFIYLQLFGLPFHPTSTSITSSQSWLLITLTDSLDPPLEILIELLWGTAWHEIGVCAPGDFNEQPGLRTTALTVSQLLFSLWILSPSHCGYLCLVPPSKTVSELPLAFQTTQVALFSPLLTEVPESRRT